jgi:hypothetical protein
MRELEILRAWKDVGCCAMAGPCTAAITSNESMVMKKYFTIKRRRVRRRKGRDKGSYIRTMPNEEG